MCSLSQIQLPFFSIIFSSFPVWRADEFRVPKETSPVLKPLHWHAVFSRFVELRRGMPEFWFLWSARGSTAWIKISQWLQTSTKSPKLTCKGQTQTSLPIFRNRHCVQEINKYIELKRELSIAGLTLRIPFLRHMTRDRIVVSRRFDTT